MALLAYNAGLRSILIQVDGSPAGSGIFYTRLKGNSAYKLAEESSFIEWVGVTLP
jgi:hypothetical protein